jgi:uncharacterized protein DUF4337
MSDAPEIPEATTDFEKKIALTIAILAVVLSLVNNLGDNSKTDAIIQTNQATDKWMYYQAKGIKQQLAEMQSTLLADLGGATISEAAKAQADKMQTEAARYDSEKGAIKTEAENLQKQAGVKSAINDRCDMSALLLQIGIVVCSVAILSQWRLFWFIGMALGAAGIVIGITAFLM